MNYQKIIVSLACLILPTLVLSCQPKTEKYQQLTGKTMGTSYHIRYQLPSKHPQNSKVDPQTIVQAIDKRLITFNNSLSTYQKDSTISRFNQAKANTFMLIDADFIKVMQDSKMVYTQSAGTFDPTVKPIFELWGFGQTMFVERLQSPPTADEIKQVQKLIDFDSITLNNNQLNKTKEGVEIDFSAIAKGYAVDVIADVLSSDYNINNYMVEIGGEVATSGVNQQGKGWTIAIDAPIINSTVKDRQLIATISQPVKKPHNNQSGKQQAGMHIATSGNYRNSIVFDGIRYSHTINPSTGTPIIGGASSITVADETVAIADAWATALTAMPYDQALALAKKLDKAVMFVVLKEGVDAHKARHSLEDFRIVQTDAMKALRGN